MDSPPADRDTQRKSLPSADVDDGRHALPGGEMANMYSHRWEIELGYREIKQTMQIEQADAEK